MTALLGTALFTLAHGALFITVLGRKPFFRSEVNVLAYHIFAFALIAATCVVAASIGMISLSGVVAAISVGAMYSMTFLQAWSLAQGSYSFSILRAVRETEIHGGTLDLSALGGIGESKQSDRLNNLISLGLLRKSGDRHALTHLGGVLANGLRALQFLCNIQRGG